MLQATEGGPSDISENVLQFITLLHGLEFTMKLYTKKKEVQKSTFRPFFPEILFLFLFFHMQYQPDKTAGLHFYLTIFKKKMIFSQEKSSFTELGISNDFVI